MTVEKTEKKPQVPLFWSLAIGSAAGGVEVAVDHPFWQLKTISQQGKPLTCNPYVLYRGVLPNMGSMVPTTAVQVGLNNTLRNYVFGDAAELSTFQKVMTAFGAGVGSALVSCPTEMVLTHQKTGVGFWSTGEQLVAQGGGKTLYTALPATALRDGLFTVFFLGVTPTLKTEMKPYFSNEQVGAFMAVVTAGLGATVVSQAFDTIKTRQQASAPREPVGFMDSAKALYTRKNRGPGLFTGMNWRLLRVTSALFLMDAVTNGLTQKYMEDTPSDSSLDAGRSP